MSQFKPNKGKRNKLAFFRFSRGLTQKEMARVLNMATITYHLIENGKENPKFIYILRLQDVFNLTDDEVMDLMEIAK